jgi:hypothetical protein
MIRAPPPPPYNQGKTPTENLNLLKEATKPSSHCYLEHLKREIQTSLSRDVPFLQQVEQTHGFFKIAGNELGIEYMDNAGPKENLFRLQKAIDTELELSQIYIPTPDPLNEVTVKGLYYEILVEMMIEYASFMQENNREDMYDTMVEFIQRVKLEKPSYEEVVSEFVQKQSYYTRTRDNFLDEVNVPGVIRRRKEPEADFVKAFRKEYNK